MQSFNECFISHSDDDFEMCQSVLRDPTDQKSVGTFECWDANSPRGSAAAPEFLRHVWKLNAEATFVIFFFFLITQLNNSEIPAFLIQHEESICQRLLPREEEIP